MLMPRARFYAYVGTDATGIMMQGPDGAKADGRMVNVGMIFNPQPRTVKDKDICKPCDGVRYLAGLYTLAELGLQMRRQGAQVGMDAAGVGLRDGWRQRLVHFIDVNFPQAEKIIDFRHVSEYVNNFAKAYRSGQEGTNWPEPAVINSNTREVRCCWRSWRDWIVAR